MLSTPPKGPFHERKSLADGSRGARRASRATGRSLRHCPREHGQRNSRAGDGRGGTGEVRPSGHADGHGRRGDRAVLALFEIRPGRSGLARPRPFRAVGRPRLDALVRSALSDRLRSDDDRGDQTLPPARFDHRRPSGIWPRARRRDHHRSARTRARQRGRHGNRREASRRGVRRRHRQSQDLRDCLRRRSDGRHQPGSDRARWPSQAQQADRAVRRQRHFDRRRAVAGRQRRSGEALRGRRLDRIAHRRPRSGGNQCGAGEGADIRQAGADRLQDQDRIRRANQGRLGKVARLAARRRGNRRRAQDAWLDICAIRSAGRYPESLARRLARAQKARMSIGRSGSPRSKAASAPNSNAA